MSGWNEFVARVRLALDRNDEPLIQELKNEVLEAHDLAEGDVKLAAQLLSVSPTSLNKITKNLDLKTEIQQAHPGRGKAKLITVGNESLTASQWAKKRGINRPTILMRQSRNWTDAEAVGIDPPPSESELNSRRDWNSQREA